MPHPEASAWGLGQPPGLGSGEGKPPAPGPAAEGTAWPGGTGLRSVPSLSPPSPTPVCRVCSLSSWRHLLGAVDSAALHLLNRRRPRGGSGGRDWDGEGPGRRGDRWGGSESSCEAAGGLTREGRGSQGRTAPQRPQAAPRGAGSTAQSRRGLKEARMGRGTQASGWAEPGEPRTPALSPRTDRAGSPGFQTWQSSTAIPVQEEGSPRSLPWRAWSPVATLLGTQLPGQRGRAGRPCQGLRTWKSNPRDVEEIIKNTDR